MDSPTTSARNRPKMSHNTLEVRKNYYVIPDGQRYHYFPIKVEDERTPRSFFRFEKAPPVLMEGIVIIGGQLYRVPIQDLMRGVIRKSREIKPAKRATDNGRTGTTATNTDGNSTSSDKAAALPSRGDQSSNLQHSDEFGSDDGSEMEVSREADLTWTDQIDALLSFIYEKEGVEWEIAEAAQP